MTVLRNSYSALPEALSAWLRLDPSVSKRMETLVSMPFASGFHSAGCKEKWLGFPGSPCSPYIPQRMARRSVVLPEPFSALITVSGFSVLVEGEITI